MEVYLRLDINIVAIVLLGAVLFIAYNRLNMQESLNKAYMRVSMIILFQLFLETFSGIINGLKEETLITISYIIHLCLNITAPILSYFGYLLIRKFIFQNKMMLKKYEIILKIPIIINIMITCLTVKYRLFFYIDQSGVYHRGTYFLFSCVITYFYFVLGCILLIRKRRRMLRQEFIYILLFSVIPLISGCIQTIYAGIVLLWSSTAFSLIILYIYLQQRIVHLDYLTGVWTKGYFVYYIENFLIQNKNKKIGIIYCDMDDFKSINDIFGHLEGDRAIIATTNIIKNAIQKNDIVVRMGGDEFAIILQEGSPKVLEETILSIQNAFIEYNSYSNKGYKLECSVGADIFNMEYFKIEEFLHHLDCLMYENKRSKKEKNKIV